MHEVSSKVLDMFFRRIKGKSVSPDALVQGLPYTVAALRKSERIDWHTFVVFMRNVGRLWSEPELIEMGRSYFDTPYMRPFSIVARLLFTASEFYKWVCAKSKGPGNQGFTCIDANAFDVGPNKLQLRLDLPEGYENCPEFFIISIGTFSAMPKVVGLPPATVEMTLTEHGALYDVTLPEERPIFQKLRQAITWPFTARAAAQELKASHEALLVRYEELEIARGIAAQHAEQLRLVNELGRELASHTSFASLSSVIDRLLEDRFSITEHKLYVSREESTAGEALQLMIGSSGKPVGEPSRKVTFMSGGIQIGCLELWGMEPSSPARPDLLDDLTPWIAIALGNARSFSMLREYQTDLEKKVADRTEQLQRALAQRIEVDQQKTLFFANASHELRTPLTLMLAPLETLISSGQLPAESKEELQSVLQSGYRLLKLVNDILDLSKVGAGKLHLQPRSLDLSELILKALKPWRAALAQRQVQVEIALPSPLRMVADPERLDQVILNLLSNAVRAAPDGGTLRVFAGREGDQVSFSIFNSGPGIAEEDLPRLFERFGQALRPSTRRFGSSGLGLPLVRDLVQLHGGEIDVDNRPGVGVTFRVVLPSPASDGELTGPAEQPSTVPAPTPIEMAQYLAGGERDQEMAPQPAPDANHSEMPTLLIAEDNADVRRFLVRSLRGDYHILEAEDGVRALELAREHVPDIVLSDVMMQSMDGMDLCRQIKADPVTFAIPVILLTARGDLEGKIQGLAYGADDYLVKPFFMEEVKARLRAQLRIRALVKQVARQEKLSAIGTIVAGVAHEIRNPLNGIINSLLPLKAVLGDPSTEVTELVDIAVESARRVEQISAQLLKQARAGEGSQSVVDLAQNIKLALQLLSHKAANGPQIEARLSESVSIVGEPGALNQVWVNLIDNAIQAAGPKGRITVNMSRENEAAVIEVADNGPGISPRHLPRIFDPFFSTKPVGTGTGLGLSVVREIVEKHGGTIAVQSSPGTGARFKILLPAANA